MRKLMAVMMLSGLTLSGAYAADVVLNDANIKQVKETLVAQGYEVAKVKKEDGLFEAYARKDGQKYEVFLDADFNVVRTKED